MVSRLTLSNRPENLKLLADFIHGWSKDRGLSPSRRTGLECVSQEIFRRLVTKAYQPDQPGSITMILEEKGPRLRLMFEDDAPLYNPAILTEPLPPEPQDPPGTGPMNGLQRWAESLVYYRTADRKNRLVVFLSL